MPPNVCSPIDGVIMAAMVTIVVTTVVVNPIIYIYIYIYNHIIKHSRNCNSRNDMKNGGINTIWLQISWGKNIHIYECFYPMKLGALTLYETL